MLRPGSPAAPVLERAKADYVTLERINAWVFAAQMLTAADGYANSGRWENERVPSVGLTSSGLVRPAPGVGVNLTASAVFVFPFLVALVVSLANALTCVVPMLSVWVRPPAGKSWALVVPSSLPVSRCRPVKWPMRNRASPMGHAPVGNASNALAGNHVVTMSIVQMDSNAYPDPMTRVLSSGYAYPKVLENRLLEPVLHHELPAAHTSMNILNCS
jgi:hypothetical protein